MRQAKCRDCGATNKYLSRKRICEQCSLDRARQTAIQMHNKRGPVWDAYKTKMISVLGIEEIKNE